VERYDKERMSKDLVQAFGEEVTIEVGYPKRHMRCVGVMQHTPYEGISDGWRNATINLKRKELIIIVHV
jgi:hypothetical protein